MAWLFDRGTCAVLPPETRDLQGGTNKNRNENEFVIDSDDDGILWKQRPCEPWERHTLREKRKGRNIPDEKTGNLLAPRLPHILTTKDTRLCLGQNLFSLLCGDGSLWP